MPNWRKGYHGPQRKPRRTRRSAATSIQSAWRARNRRRKGGLVVRTVQSNYKKIKNIKRDIQPKHIQSIVASGPYYEGQYTEGARVDYTGSDINSDPVGLMPLHGLTEGTDDNQRIGNDIILKRLTIKLIVRAGHTNIASNGPIFVGDQQQRLVFALVKDLKPTGRLPTYSTVFNTMNASLFNPQSNFLNLDFIGSRFKIIQRKSCTVYQNQPYYTNGVDISYNHLPSIGSSIKCLTMGIKAPFKFKYTSGTVPGNQDLYLIMCSNVRGLISESFNNLPSVTIASRVSYKDP